MQVTCASTSTTLIADAASKDEIDMRIAQLKKELAETDSVYDTGARACAAACAVRLPVQRCGRVCERACVCGCVWRCVQDGGRSAPRCVDACTCLCFRQ